jgi:hypothetical protein
MGCTGDEGGHAKRGMYGERKGMEREEVMNSVCGLVGRRKEREFGRGGRGVLGRNEKGMRERGNGGVGRRKDMGHGGGTK